MTVETTYSLQSSYNLINLPAQIKSGDTVKAKYTYLSDGTKAAAYTSTSAGRDSDFGARLYDRTAWTAIDPMAEKYYDISPYLYCAGNPLVFGDPTGEDYYYLHKDGTITLAYIDDLDKDNDYLWSLSETEAFGQYLSFRVSDKTILKSLSQVSLKDNYSHSVLSDSSEIIDLFDFIVHNSSKREWAMGLFQTKEGNKYALIQGKKSSGVLAVEYLDSIDPLDLRVKIHTHVGEIQDHGASGYVQGPTIVPNDHSNYNTLKKLFDSHKKNMPRHYVYEVPYGFIYEYNANNGAKPYGKYSLSRLRNLMK